LTDSAIENDVHIIELPEHTSHWLQPCDRTVYDPFKNAYRKACEELCSSFPRSVVCKKTFCGLLKKAWQEGVTPSNILSGFRACGLYPFDPSAIPREAFIPNSLYVVDEGEKAADSVDPDVMAANHTVSETNKQLQSPLLQSTAGENVNVAEVVWPSSTSTSDPEVISATPALALALFEQLECFKFCSDRGYDLVTDELFVTWKQLKLMAAKICYSGR